MKVSSRLTSVMKLVRCLNLLEVSNIHASYGEIKALWDIKFQVPEGEIVSILGPNGAGKTTLFKAITGQIYPSQGRIIFNNKDITRLPAHERVNLGISYTPEGRGLFPFMSVKENLILGSYSKHARPKRDKSLKWVFELFPRLLERISQEARTLSGGEQQMLAVGRSLMADPSLLILDEPSLGLAPKIVHDLFEIFKQVNEEGVTVLLSEQHVHMALKIAKDGYVMEEGRIILQGTAEELSNNEHIKSAYLGI